jgi:hypothetical protein
MLKAVYNTEIKDKFAVYNNVDKEKIDMARPEVQTIASHGIYGLTLNTANKIENMDLLYIAETAPVPSDML